MGRECMNVLLILKFEKGGHRKGLSHRILFTSVGVWELKINK